MIRSKTAVILMAALVILVSCGGGGGGGPTPIEGPQVSRPSGSGGASVNDAGSLVLDRALSYTFDPFSDSELVAAGSITMNISVVVNDNPVQTIPNGISSGRVDMAIQAPASGFVSATEFFNWVLEGDFSHFIKQGHSVQCGFIDLAGTGDQFLVLVNNPMAKQDEEEPSKHFLAGLYYWFIYAQGDVLVEGSHRHGDYGFDVSVRLAQGWNILRGNQTGAILVLESAGIPNSAQWVLSKDH